METRFPKFKPAGLLKAVPNQKIDKAEVLDPTSKPAPERRPAALEQPQVHAVVERATPNGHVVPLTTRAKADPIIGASERVRVSERVATPKRPEGCTPRFLWQELIVMDTGSDAARALIGRTELVEKLKGVGFDVEIATEWRTFFSEIDRVSTNNGRPNPSAKGRAEFADWVVVQLGGASAGLWKGAAA